MSGQNVVSSEIHQDTFLNGLSVQIFHDDDDDGEPEEEENDLTVDEFEVTNFGRVKIGHYRATEIDLVGLQIWRGALLLADFLLSNPGEIAEKSVLELAGGTGITSVVVAKFLRPKSVICSDRGSITRLIGDNFALNECPIPTTATEIDFFRDEWKSRLKSEIGDAGVILTADVAYNEAITDAFSRSLRHVLSEGGEKKRLDRG